MKIKNSQVLLVVLVIVLTTLLMVAIVSPDAIVRLFLGQAVIDPIGSMV